MTISGGPMDPVSLRMAEEERLRQEAIPAKGKSRLEDAAGFLPVAESEAAEKLMDLVEAELFDRICKVLAEDAQALAILNILNAFNTRRDVARRAVKQLMNHP